MGFFSFKKRRKSLGSTDNNCEFEDFPNVRYNFPKNGNNPFDFNVNDRYFIDASGLTNLTDHLADFEIDKIRAEIPGGYKTVIVLHRVLMIKSGKLIKEWDYDNNIKSYKEPLLGGYMTEYVGGFYLISNKSRPLFGNHPTEKTYSICKPKSDNTSLQAHVWMDKDKAIKYAFDLSAQNSETIIVAQVIQDIYWH